MNRLYGFYRMIMISFCLDYNLHNFEINFNILALMKTKQRKQSSFINKLCGITKSFFNFVLCFRTKWC